MHKVSVIVTVEVDGLDRDTELPLTDATAESIARQAVRNALNYESRTDFQHNHVPTASVKVVSVGAYDPMQFGHCPAEDCPGVVGPDGQCSHCGDDYEDEADEH